MLKEPSMHESVELRSRNKNHVASETWHQESPTTGRNTYLEHSVKNGETLMHLSLNYSVPVSEIKRINNIVVDQEIHGLSVVRVPISRAYLLQRQLMEADGSGMLQGEILHFLTDDEQAHCPGTSNSARNINKFTQHSNNSETIPLMDDQDMRGSKESLTGRAREVIECILDETDKNVATVRQNLPSPSLEGGGTFHFVDAGRPDNSSSIWLIVIFVIALFVLLPLGLTFLEETGEVEEHHQHRPQH